MFFNYHASSVTLGERTHAHKMLNSCEAYKNYKWMKENKPGSFVQHCLENVELSTKLKVLFGFLQQWKGKERVLIISQTTTMLDVIEEKCQ